jgi:hypothetical protein
MEMIRCGHISTVMEDKWNLFMEDDHAYFHRSWTVSVSMKPTSLGAPMVGGSKHVE